MNGKPLVSAILFSLILRDSFKKLLRAYLPKPTTTENSC